MKFELNYDGFEQDDFEREIHMPCFIKFEHENYLLPFIIAEYEPNDDFIYLISVDSRVFISESLSDIVWFLESHINQIRELIGMAKQENLVESPVMNIHIELYMDFEEAYRQALILKNDEIEKDEDDFVFPDDLDKL